MQFAASGLIGRPVAASDGRIGAVKDFLIDDRCWKVRWLVVSVGQFLPGRKVLIYPSAIAPVRLPPRPAIPMLSFGEQMEVVVNLTARQIEAGPEAPEDEPVTEAFEQRLFDHYGWDPFWSAPALGGEPAILRPAAHAIPPETPPDAEGDGERRLGSAAAMKGFAVRASDGDAGTLDNVFIDDVRWTVRYLVVATGGWLHHRLVQAPIRTVTAVDWQGHSLSLNVSRERVRSAPSWDPLTVFDDIAEERLHGHFARAERR